MNTAWQSLKVLLPSPRTETRDGVEFSRKQLLGRIFTKKKNIQEKNITTRTETMMPLPFKTKKPSIKVSLVTTMLGDCLSVVGFA